MKFESYSAEQTKDIAKTIADRLSEGDILLLDGELGAGKTVFASGFAAAKGYKGYVSSPTFTLVNEYDGDGIMIYHFDMYRIENCDDSDSLGIDDYLFGDGICLIEWSEKISSLIPEGAYKVTITKNTDFGDDYRLIEFEGENI